MTERTLIDVDEYVAASSAPEFARLTARADAWVKQHSEMWPCAGCDEMIVISWNDGARKPRNDRRYCTHACQQAAYRERLAASRERQADA